MPYRESAGKEILILILVPLARRGEHGLREQRRVGLPHGHGLLGEEVRLHVGRRSEWAPRHTGFQGRAGQYFIMKTKTPVNHGEH